MDEKQVQAIADEARATFDLAEFLQGASRHHETIKVYTDEEAGHEIGGHEVIRKDGPNGLTVPGVRSWGLKGEYEELTRTPELKKKNAKRIKEIESRTAELLQRLEETSLTFELHSVPAKVSKGARRKAREHLGITEKGVPDHLLDDFAEELVSQNIALACRKITRGDGAVIDNPPVEQIRAISDYLPRSEQTRLYEKINELLFATHISSKAVEDADF